MSACHILRAFAFTASLLPFIGYGQDATTQAGTIAAIQLRTALPAFLLSGEPESDFSANVPMNEISIRAFRHFRHLYPSGISAENWYKSSQGYEVSFLLDNHRNRVYFDPKGAFLFGLKYGDGKEAPRRTGEYIKKNYPDYRIETVTEISNGEKTFYSVKIVSPSFVRTLFFDEERVETTEVLINGGL
jgi:hypothetical protein